MKRWLPVLLLLGACDRHQPVTETVSAGARLEKAAIDTGLVVDPASVSLAGSWARDTDRACIVPLEGKRSRIGVLVDYGEGQGCAATGEVERSGDRLRVRFGGCRFDAGFDGSRISFPAEVPATCAALCVGRASLAALSVDRLSESVSEAETLRTPGGRDLCPAG